MRLRILLAAAGILGALSSAALSQTYTPQSSSRLAVSFTTERVGSGRVLVYGEVRNGSDDACERVIVKAEGLDEKGRVVSRGRAYVFGVVPSRGSSPFEVRMSSPGSERRFRVEIESFQFVSSGS
ncbi:MAG: FxLYD domain-containing protein [Candidatus Rokuibacteriota bacterium]